MELSRSKSEQTRERIVQAAQRLFAARGFDGATTASIASAAGVAEKTLFKYFPSKKDLLVDSVYPALLSVLQLPTQDRPAPSLAAALQAVVQDRLNFAQAHPDLFRLLVQELLLRDDFRSSMQARWQTVIYPALQTLLQAAQARGELRALPAPGVVRALVGATVAQACIAVVFAPPEPQDTEATAREIVDVLLRGIGM